MWGFDASWQLKFLNLKLNNLKSQYNEQKLRDKYGKMIDLRNRMAYITQCCNNNNCDCLKPSGDLWVELIRVFSYPSEYMYFWRSSLPSHDI